MHGFNEHLDYLKVLWKAKKNMIHLCHATRLWILSFLWKENKKFCKQNVAIFPKDFSHKEFYSLSFRKKIILWWQSKLYPSRYIEKYSKISKKTFSPLAKRIFDILFAYLSYLLSVLVSITVTGARLNVIFVLFSLSCLCGRGKKAAFFPSEHTNKQFFK